MADVLRRHAIPANARLTLALSGGLDSTVLLDVLQQLRHGHPFALRAIHVHHGLSPHAGSWADFCRTLCAQYGVELDVVQVAISAADPAGIEAAARRERQRIFSTLDCDVLLTAHQQDDQAETLLLQLLRGAGPKGAAAMAEARRPPGWRALHLRPLLGVRRSALDRYAAARNLAWVSDESNADVRYRRNALRHEVMPPLVRHFPGAVAALARAAELQAEAAALLDDLARMDAADGLVDGRLECRVLAALPPPRARNLLRHFIETQGAGMPAARVLDEALRQLLEARHDARVRVNLGHCELWRYGGAAYLVPPAPPPAPPVPWRGEPVLWVTAAGVHVEMLPVVGTGLRRALLDAGPVSLGVRRGGERLRLHPEGPHRSLKNLLQERRIPPWTRARVPLLWCGDTLVWAAGIGWGGEWAAGPGEPGVLPRVHMTLRGETAAAGA